MDDRFEEGRTSAAEALIAALPSAPTSYLAGALQNPALGPAESLALLRNPLVTAEMVARLTDLRRSMDAYEVRVAVALHQATPRHLAQHLLGHLRWRDLARSADLQRLAPPLRRAAERLLAIRIRGLALGERIALARLATRGVLHVLRHDENPIVIRALLLNPKVVEEDVLTIAAAKTTPGPILQALALDGRFAARPAVQRAIVLHASTPPVTALRIVRRLPVRTLEDLSANPRAPALVRVAAERLLDERRLALTRGRGAEMKNAL
jgi:hypothetical protein